MSRQLGKVDKIHNKLSDVMPLHNNPVPRVSLQNNYLYDFEEEDFEGFNPIFKKSFCLANATPGQLVSFKKKMAQRKFQKEINDTGSPPVQAAMFSEKILHMAHHMKNNPGDLQCYRYVMGVWSGVVNRKEFD